MPLAQERANRARTGQPLARDERDAVELELHALEIRYAPGHDQPEHQADQRGGDEEHHAQPGVDQKRGGHRADGEQGEPRHLADRQGYGELNLVDVVGDSSDERRRACLLYTSM